MTSGIRKPRFRPVDLNTVPSAMEQLAASWRRKTGSGCNRRGVDGKQR